MSMTLYHGEPVGPSFTVLAALFEKGLDAELVHIELATGARHMLACAGQAEVAMSVEGEGPVLVVDGEGMTDSVFVACYLDDIGDGPPLRPAEPYARWETMMWCRQIIERTAPAAALLGCRARPPRAGPALLERIGSTDLRQRWRDAGAGRFPEASLADSEAKIVQTAEKVEARLEGREWLMDAFSIADLETYAWMSGMRDIVPAVFAGKPRLAAWLARVERRPASIRALAKTANRQGAWAPGPEINRWG